MKRLISIIILFTAIVLSGCSDKLTDGSGTTIVEGELTDCRMGLRVGDFQVISSTRATEEEKKASDAEKKIDNIWVFQYDENGNLILAPKYYESDNCKNDDGSWNVVLYVNKSTIYVVANTNDATWASSESDFATLAALKAKSLPSPEPIQVGSGDGFVEADDVTIPMAGSKEVETTSFASDITVEVERMYAKLIISAQMLNDINMTGMEVNNIPYTCQIEPRSTDPKQTTGATYSSVEFITRSYNTNSDATTSNGSSKTSSDYVIYVPENIQGVNSDYLSEEAGGNTYKGKDYGVDDGQSPTNALAVKYSLSIKRDNSDSRVQSSATIFPGANNTNNFNVNRNYVYKVSANFSDKDYFFPTPSANCFVVEPGETLTFWPYYRTEKGGNYNFKDYLDPTNPDKAIKGLKIIWQDKDVLGDNTNGDLVKISSGTIEGDYNYIIRNFTIDVKTNKKGNALIGAYNNAKCTGDVIWSWHIWVTDVHPDNVGNALRYTTYDWDKTGIHTDKARIPGYQVMPCNLGAKALQNSGTNSSSHLDLEEARGTLYQWGRKDPFPPMLWGTGSFSDFCEKYAGVHYGNDNSTKVTKTSNYDESYGFYTKSGQNISDPIHFAIAHPTVFVAGVTEAEISNFTNTESGNQSALYDRTLYFNDGDWCSRGHSDNKLWGSLDPENDQDKLDSLSIYYYTNKKNCVYLYIGKTADVDFYGSKSIFDPCPTGWRVPPGELWMGFTSTGKNPTNITGLAATSKEAWQKQVNYDSERSYRNQMYMYLNGWQTGNGSYFPTQGPRLGDGRGMRWSSCGNYHSATCGSYNRINALHMHNYGNYKSSTGSYVTLFNVFENGIYGYHTKSCAGPIRCVRDKK